MVTYFEQIQAQVLDILSFYMFYKLFSIYSS
jgi:hypothetical protein